MARFYTASNGYAPMNGALVTLTGIRSDELERNDWYEVTMSIGKECELVHCETGEVRTGMNALKLWDSGYRVVRSQRDAVTYAR